MPRRPALTFRLALLVCSLLLSLLAAEAALRVWYRDAGRRTLGGPGGRTFDHETIDGELRGRRDVGPRSPGVPRIMVVGDSITYGLGIHDWRETWPERLARLLAQAEQPHELAVFAFPGQDIPQHVNVVREWAERVAPDIFIYQWYVNDLEAISHRPRLLHRWQRLPWHDTLHAWSYLYYVADIRLAQLLPPPTRSYVDYLLTDFRPGTLEWVEFERDFHEFAIRASHVSRRRLMVLYPQVPFSGVYPLRPIHDRMRALAGPHAVEIPPAAWSRVGGALVGDETAPFKQVVTLAQGAAGAVMTPEYVFPAGPLRVEVVVRTAGGAGAPPLIVDVIDAATGMAVSEHPMPIVTATAAWSPVAIPVAIGGAGLRRVRFRVRSAASEAWTAAAIRLPVDYGFDVIDLAEPLNAFPTHVSVFDAHPNADAQRVMSEQIFTALTGKPPVELPSNP